jgi:hypothetical protein
VIFSTNAGEVCILKTGLSLRRLSCINIEINPIPVYKSVGVSFSKLHYCTFFFFFLKSALIVLSIAKTKRKMYRLKAIGTMNE